ncbi:MAG: M10 family metallopeptidase, partial [Azonexus sp.]
MATPTTWGAYSYSSSASTAAVDSLIYGTQWSNKVISYSFPNAASYWSTDSMTGYGPTYFNAEPWVSGYQGLDPSDILAVRKALVSWAGVAKISFVEVPDNSSTVGDLRFAYASGAVSDGQAWTYMPGGYTAGGDVWFNADGTSHFYQWIEGSYVYLTAVHEIGHALGLKHPFSASFYNDTVLDSSLDSRSFTIMSYSAQPGNNATYFSYEPTGPMVLDVAAIQSLYGANYSYNSGNTNYVYDGSSTYHQTIWDGGGIDAITYTSSAGGLIDLRAGVSYGSKLGNAVYVNDVYGTHLYSVNNIWISYGVVIENATGGSGNDQLVGNDVGNVLNGGAGADTLIGGLGDDTYVIDNVGDLVSELSNQGTDLVQIGIATAGGSYTLTDNVENATLSSVVAFKIIGNSLDNILIGNTGNDTLDGGAGNDTMNGGAGNDTYYTDSVADVITDSAGTDTVIASDNYSIGSTIENLTLTAWGHTGTGNALANILTGAGNDTLIGGAGDDTYYLTGGDIALEDVSGGTETVVASASYTLGDNLENLILTGSDPIEGAGNSLNNTLTGNSGDNFLFGDAGNDSLVGGAGNDSLRGGVGTDSLIGGSGDDTYIIDLTATNAVQDILTEAASAGTDTLAVYGGSALSTAVTISLAANFENLNVSETGAAKLNLIGNSANNFLTGNDADNILDGGAGSDTLIGGAGNDTYVVDSFSDLIYENFGGDTAGTADTVIIKIASSGVFTLGDFIENATLSSTVAFSLIGNFLDNTLIGNSGNDTLDGGTGIDAMNGGAGNDTYYVDSSFDSITDTAGIDTVITSVSYTSLDYTLVSGLENLTLTTGGLTGTGNMLANILTGVGDDTLIGGAGNDTYNVCKGDLAIETISGTSGGVDTVVSSASYTLGDNLENLILTGSGSFEGAGNTLNNTLGGNTGNDRLSGLDGNDTLNGGAGHDTLDGGTGADLLNGGAGDDLYLVNLKSVGSGVAMSVALEDTISELANEGTDTLQLSGSIALTNATTLTLNANFENLDASGAVDTKLNLTGTAVANILTGNNTANILNGLAGADSLIGGDGNDTYVLDNVGDLVSELSNQGTDLVQIGIATANGSYTLSGNVENGTLTNTVAFNLTGNALDNQLIGNGAANILDGGAGNDTLNGGAGADSLIGGLGNDTYVLDNV